MQQTVESDVPVVVALAAIGSADPEGEWELSAARRRLFAMTAWRSLASSFWDEIGYTPPETVDEFVAFCEDRVQGPDGWQFVAIAKATLMPCQHCKDVIRHTHYGYQHDRTRMVECYYAGNESWTVATPCW